jgi:ATP-dependent DNA helicase DinG
MAEAGTGVGKSLAYLIPSACWAILNDVPVVVSTNTKNLQTQLIEQDLPLVQKLLTAEAKGNAPLLRTALLKGRKNYLCLRNFVTVLENNDYSYDRAHRRNFAQLVAWAAFTKDGDLDVLTMLHPRIPESFAAEFSSSSEECSGRKCRHFRRCFVQKARQKANKAHIVVANHSLVFADASAPGVILPLYSQIVFDEAHNLEDAATDHYSQTVSESEIGHVLRRVSAPKSRMGVVDKLRKVVEEGTIAFTPKERTQFKKRLSQCASSVERIRKKAASFFAEMANLIPQGASEVRYQCVCDADTLVRRILKNRVFVPCSDEEWDEKKTLDLKNALRDALADAIGELKAAAAMIEESRTAGELPLFGDQTALLDGAAAELSELSLNVEFLFSAQDAGYVFWASASERARSAKRHSVALNAAPLSIGEALARDFYKEKKTIVFSSATLRYNSSFSFVGRRLGLGLVESGKLKTALAESPFNYLTQCKVLSAGFLPPPDGGALYNGTYKEQLGALLCDILRITRGRALALFTSFESMLDVAAQVEKPLRDAGVTLLVHNRDGSRDEITGRFKKQEAAVLFGVQSFWEGVDIPGPALRCVIICRLPFASVGDPIFSARCEQIKSNGGNDFREYSIPQAVIKFRQGFGRLIRTCTDRGLVIIADSRFSSKGYGIIFRKALPCPVVDISSRESMIEEVSVSVAEIDQRPDGR